MSTGRGQRACAGQSLPINRLLSSSLSLLMMVRRPEGWWRERERKAEHAATQHLLLQAFTPLCAIDQSRINFTFPDSPDLWTDIWAAASPFFMNDDGTKLVGIWNCKADLRVRPTIDEKKVMQCVVCFPKVEMTGNPQLLNVSWKKPDSEMPEKCCSYSISCCVLCLPCFNILQNQYIKKKKLIFYSQCHIC